jgi:hypothetical protein
MIDMARWWAKQARVFQRRAREAIRRGQKHRAMGMPHSAAVNMLDAGRELDRAEACRRQARLWAAMKGDDR